ncbi:DUF2989 domain-containing protein [Vibrio mediterranei]|uniref:DUF2989 domain-containing protein n=1 Tax=Vibrio mediterranei TaxID=689 RepID=UPI001EFE01A3|nr:DUF2989 domain-containing protein [Vibrio mediterranei]MCG9664748.1 DUF2989 domain-containing protein [Vibrio mediterranei]
MKLPYLLSALVATSLLSGCFETRKNTDQLCESEPSLNCSSLNINDGQCRIARTDLIWHRYEMLDDPSEKNQVKDYHLLKEYRKCLELASQIQPIEQADLKTKRFNALMYSIEEQERITRDLASSTSPETLYFLWSETGSQAAKRRFLAMENTGVLDTSSMQYALATYYISRDKQKTYQLLNRALELSAGGKYVNKEVIKSLASVTQNLDLPKQSYLWAMVGKEFDVPIASDNELRLLFGLAEEDYRSLNEQAKTVAKAIDNGNYTRDLVLQ